MSTIYPTAPTSNVISPYSDPGSLTGESLLLYCQSQLTSLDGTIKGYFDEQKLNLVRKKALSDLENTLKKYVNHADQAATNDIIASFNNAMAALPPGDPTRGAIQDKYNEFLNHGDGTTIHYTSEEMTALAGDIHSMLDNVNGNAELNMIQLQQVMAQRQTAVQLTTSLMAKLDDGTKAIVTNIGR